MCSEVFRGSTLAMLLSFGIFIASTVIGVILTSLSSATGQNLYLYLSECIPTWAATSFPSFLMSELITAPSTALPVADPETLYLATAIIAVYTIIFLLIAVYRLLKTDVTKKTA